MVLRVAPAVQSAVLIAAQANGVSLNLWAAGVLQAAAHGCVWSGEGVEIEPAGWDLVAQVAPDFEVDQRISR